MRSVHQSWTVHNFNSLKATTPSIHGCRLQDSLQANSKGKHHQRLNRKHMSQAINGQTTMISNTSKQHKSACNSSKGINIYNSEECWSEWRVVYNKMKLECNRQTQQCSWEQWNTIQMTCQRPQAIRPNAERWINSPSQDGATGMYQATRLQPNLVQTTS